MNSHRLSIAATLSALVFAGCKPSTPAPRVGLDGPRAAASATPPKDPRGSGLFATSLGKISDGVSGPDRAGRGDRALAVTGGPRGDAFALIAQPLDLGAKVTGEARALGAVGGTVSLLTVRALGPEQFVAVVATRTERGHLVLAAVIGADGALRGKLVEVHQSAEPVTWIDAVSAGPDVAVLLASSAGGAATVRASILGATGLSASAAASIAVGARAWAAASTKDGPLLVTMASDGGRDRVRVQPIDPQRKAPSPPTLLAEAARIAPEVEVVSTPDGAIVAWTEGDDGEGRVRLARVVGGKLAGTPRAAGESAGDQALLGLEASRDKILVAWEDGGAVHRATRRVELATLSSDLATPFGRTHMSLGTPDAGAPMLAPLADGFALLGLARACAKEAASCGDAPIGPVYVRASGDLGHVRAVPLTVDRLAGEAPEGAWGLACGERACLAAASGPDELFGVSLDGDVSEVTSPLPAARRTGAPAVRASGVILRGRRLASTSHARLASSWLFATVTEHAEGTPPPPLPPDVDARAEAEKDRLHEKNPKRGSARGAMVRLVSVDDKDRASPPVTLSVRALSTGGVAIAPSAAADEAVVAWVARDDGDPQVFLTRVGPDAKRRGQTMLTSAKGDVSEVALAAVPDGYLVVWVDERDGNGEVYAARVDKVLRKLGPEQRITQAKGNASSLAVRVVGSEAWVAFSDSRGIESGAGDVFMAKLDVAKATKRAEELRLASTAQHARALRFVGTPTGLSILFVDTPAGATGGSWVGRRVPLGANGDPQPAAPLALPDAGDPTSLDVACDAQGCRLAVVRRTSDGLTLAAGALSPDGAVTLHELYPLLAAPGTAHDPMLAGDSIVVADDGAIAGEGRLRRIAVKWR